MVNGSILASAEYIAAQIGVARLGRPPAAGAAAWSAVAKHQTASTQQAAAPAVFADGAEQQGRASKRARQYASSPDLL